MSVHIPRMQHQSKANQQKCDHEYDRFQIEQPLIQMVSRIITSFQTQDVICVKCSQTKDDNLAPTCKCGGAFRTSINKGEVKVRLRMIKSGESYVIISGRKYHGGECLHIGPGT